MRISPSHNPSRPLLPDLPGRAEGICGLAKQASLSFGWDRGIRNKNKTKADSRPVFSLVRRDPWLFVLPGTRKKNKRFFHIAKGLCGLRGPKEDTYLCPGYEGIAPHDFEAYGSLSPKVCAAILEWLRERYG